MIKSGHLEVHLLTRKDKQLLAKWLSTPEVLQYYEGRDNPFDIEKVERDFLNHNPDVTRCLVIFGGIPIGFLQFYEIDEEEREIYGYGISEEMIYGMDQFIGETTYWNKGIGTQLVRSVVTYLIQEKGVQRIVMDPQIQNERTIRCYEKCGFKKVKLLPRHELHEGTHQDCWLIEYS